LAWDGGSIVVSRIQLLLVSAVLNMSFLPHGNKVADQVPALSPNSRQEESERQKASHRCW
jgi:hypothetical protein